jgi:type IV pilus assembly protein PilW
MKTYKSHQKGMSLIELLVAMAISVTLLGGLVEVYLGSKQSYNLAEESSRLQENGRFAIDILTREIRGSDFWGCLRKPDGQSLYNNLNQASADYDPSQHEFGEAVTGVDGGGSNPDSISFGGAYGKGINVTQQMVQSSAVIMVNADNGLDQNDIIILSDCSSGDIFQVSNANPGGTGTVVHNTGNPTAGPGNVTDPGITGCNGANAHCLSKVYGTDAQVYEMRRIGYDIRPSINPGANGANGLFRTEDGNSVEIIENVENMQILYGEDTDADRFHTPNQYVNATDIGANIGNAISVRIALLLRGEQDVLPQNTAQTHQLLDATVNTNDRRLYRVFTTTITIRNRALIDSL